MCQIKYRLLYGFMLYFFWGNVSSFPQYHTRVGQLIFKDYKKKQKFRRLLQSFNFVLFYLSNEIFSVTEHMWRILLDLYWAHEEIFLDSTWESPAKTLNQSCGKKASVTKKPNWDKKKKNSGSVNGHDATLLKEAIILLYFQWFHYVV